MSIRRKSVYCKLGGAGVLLHEYPAILSGTGYIPICTFTILKY